MTTPCYCGHPVAFADCCDQYLSGKTAPNTAEQLMRSRYSAYATNNMDYIERTCAGKARTSFDARTASKRTDPAIWLDLSVQETEQGQQGDDVGMVEFVARYRDARGIHSLHERSLFQRIDGQWFYVDGEHLSQTATTPKVGRNDPCPCDSGKKYKKCCGQ